MTRCIKHSPAVRLSSLNNIQQFDKWYAYRDGFHS